MTREKFYCENCGVVNHYLETEANTWDCPHCGHPIFGSIEALEHYLHVDEPNFIEPFEKSKKMRQS